MNSPLIIPQSELPGRHEQPCFRPILPWFLTGGTRWFAGRTADAESTSPFRAQGTESDGSFIGMATRQANIRIRDAITTIGVRARCESHRQAGHAECVSSWVDARAKKMKKVNAEKPTDKRPVWGIKPDSTDPHVIESLRFQCAMDGSRAAWKPIEK